MVRNLMRKRPGGGMPVAEYFVLPDGRIPFFDEDALYPFMKGDGRRYQGVHLASGTVIIQPFNPTANFDISGIWDRSHEYFVRNGDIFVGWTAKSVAHSFAMDKQGRVWIAARIRPNQAAAFCQQGSTHPSAAAFPIAQSGRQMQLYDPKTGKVSTIDTCFGTHHLNFAEDANNTLWLSNNTGRGGAPAIDSQARITSSNAVS